MTTMQDRVSRLEGAFEQVSLTLQGLQNQITGLQNQIDSIQQRLTALENRIMMMWLATMGTMVAGFITLFVAIMMRS